MHDKSLKKRVSRLKSLKRCRINHLPHQFVFPNSDLQPVFLWYNHFVCCLGIARKIPDKWECKTNFRIMRKGDTQMTIQVGDGATYHIGSDRYPYTVVEILTPRRLQVRAEVITLRKNGRWHRLGECHECVETDIFDFSWG